VLEPAPSFPFFPFFSQVYIAPHLLFVVRFCTLPCLSDIGCKADSLKEEPQRIAASTVRARASGQRSHRGCVQRSVEDRVRILGRIIIFAVARSGLGDLDRQSTILPTRSASIWKNPEGITIGPSISEKGGGGSGACRSRPRDWSISLGSPFCRRGAGQFTRAKIRSGLERTGVQRGGGAGAAQRRT